MNACNGAVNELMQKQQVLERRIRRYSMPEKRLRSALRAKITPAPLLNRAVHAETFVKAPYF